MERSSAVVAMCSCSWELRWASPAAAPRQDDRSVRGPCRALRPVRQAACLQHPAAPKQKSPHNVMIRSRGLSLKLSQSAHDLLPMLDPCSLACPPLLKSCEAEADCVFRNSMTRQSSPWSAAATVHDQRVRMTWQPYFSQMLLRDP